MRVLEIEQGSTDWMAYREGKRTGTTVGKIFAKSRATGELYDTEKPLITFYQKVAERLAIGTGDDGLDSSRERGKDLEQEAINEAEQKLGLDLIRGNVWVADDERHIESPDAYTKDLKTAVEIKCLSSARHIQAIIEDRPPAEYYAEYLNYFMVNPKLKILYVFLYDPRFILPELCAYSFKLERKALEYDIERMSDVDAEAERKIDEAVQNLIKRFKG